MTQIRGRSLSLFFAGFVFGALSVTILLGVRGRASSPRIEQRQSAADRGVIEEPQPSRPIGLPIEGLHPSDILDSFYQKRDGRLHEATDIMAPRGTPVHAADSGIIRKLFTSKAGGLTIYQFDPNQVYCYYYAHLDRYAEGLGELMPVKRGQVIGYVGSTGNASAAAPHLHFAIFLLGPEKRWWEGKPINPYPILMQASMM